MIYLLLIFVAVWHSTYGIDKKEALATCMQQYGITEDVSQNFMQNGEVLDESNMNQKCFFLCVLNKLGMSDESGNMDLPKIKDMMVIKYDKMNNNDVITLIDKCASRSETDPCDKVYYFHKCHMKPYLEILKG